MSNVAVLQIIQHNTGASTFEALSLSSFAVRLLNPDDYTDLGAIPGLAAGEWIRVGNEAAVDVAEAIGAILTQNRVPFKVEWV
jgi:hypothetical protein